MNASDDSTALGAVANYTRPFDEARSALDRVIDLSGRLLADEGLLEALDWELAGGRPAEPGLLEQWGTAFTRGLRTAKVTRR